MLTACVEVMPVGLSSTTQPCTSRLSRLNCLRFGAASAASLIVNCQVARDRRRAQQLVDTLSLLETVVNAKANVRRKFQIDAARDLGAQALLVAFERF